MRPKRKARTKIDGPRRQADRAEVSLLLRDTVSSSAGRKGAWGRLGGQGVDCRQGCADSGSRQRTLRTDDSHPVRENRPLLRL